MIQTLLSIKKKLQFVSILIFCPPLVGSVRTSQDSVLKYFKMFCPAFQTGNLCQVNINECASSPCLNKGTCVDGVASFTCLCELPYSGPTCAEVLTPCSPNPCANHAACTHTPDYLGYQCNCQPGWQGKQLYHCNTDSSVGRCKLNSLF